jgi:hypothetical protein
MFSLGCIKILELICTLCHFILETSIQPYASLNAISAILVLLSSVTYVNA